MSGKTARRLRRLAEQATGGKKGSTTIQPGDERSYKKHHVQSTQRPGSLGESPVAVTIRTERHTPRAFYQEVKRSYKNGEAQREADRLEKEYRHEQVKAAKGVADQIAAIVEAGDQQNVVEESLEQAIQTQVDNMAEYIPAQPVIVFPEQAKNMNPMEWLDEFTGWAMKEDNRIAHSLPLQILTGCSSAEAGYLTVTGLEEKTEMGLNFVISSAGYIRAYDGEVISLLTDGDKETLFKEVYDILVADMQYYKDIKIMEVVDAQ